LVNPRTGFPGFFTLFFHHANALSEYSHIILVEFCLEKAFRSSPGIAIARHFTGLDSETLRADALPFSCLANSQELLMMYVGSGYDII
jgi:hypothetical protein